MLFLDFTWRATPLNFFEGSSKGVLGREGGGSYALTKENILNLLGPEGGGGCAPCLLDHLFLPVNLPVNGVTCTLFLCMILPVNVPVDNFRLRCL